MRKNRWIRVLLVLSMLLLLTGTTAAARTKLTVGTWLAVADWESQYGDQMNVFRKNNPDIELEVITIASSPEYAAKILMLWATGGTELPDVMQVPPEQVAPLVNAGIYEDLRPWVARDPSVNINEWLPGALHAVQFQGVMFGVPAYVVNYTYAYNKDILASRGIVPPSLYERVSWAQIEEIAKKAHYDADGDGSPEIWGYYHGTSYTELLPLVFQAGGTIFDDNQLIKLNTPEAIEGVNWLVNLIRSGWHGGNRTAFYNQQVATMRFGSWEMPNIISSQVPMGVTSGIQHKVASEVAYITPYCMTSSSKNKDAAWRFLKWQTTRESQNYVAARPRVPVRRDVQMPAQFRELLTGLINALEVSLSYPYHVHSNNIQTLYNRLAAPIFRLEQAPGALLPVVQDAINAYLREQM